MSKNISDKDKKDWQNFTESKEKLHVKDAETQSKKKIKVRHIDLHGYTLKEANTKIENFIINSYHEGVAKLVVVTGKGLHSDVEKDPYVSRDLSILKYSIPEFVKNNSDLSKYINYFSNAAIEDGGEGAFYIYLKKNIKL